MDNQIRNGDASNWRKRQKVIPTIIAVSDLHGNMKKWEVIKRLLKCNPKTIIYILGDAMDRGEDGLRILLEIKTLSEKTGRVKYIPGNHDSFAYDFMTYNFKKSKDEIEKKIYDDAEYRLITNGGYSTVKQLKTFGAENIKAFKELTEWLGSLPVQRVVTVNGQIYALAHAVFDNEMYQWSKYFNLKEAQDYYHTFCILDKELFNIKNKKLNAQTLAILRENSLYNEMFKGKNHKLGLEELLTIKDNLLNRYEKFINIMDYREDDKRTQHAPLMLPTDCKMIVGHTHQDKVNERKLYGVPIVYIDTGLDERNFAGYNLTYDCPQPLFIRDNPSRDPLHQQNIH